MGYVSVADSLGIYTVSSTTSMQCAQEGADFVEITQNKGHDAGQGHSRSPISVPIESYTLPRSDYYELTSYRAPFPIAFDRSKIALSTSLAFNSPPPPDGRVPLGRSS